MSDEQIHYDLYAKMGGELYFIGHSDVDQPTSNQEHLRGLANLLHRIAWEYEDKADEEDPQAQEYSVADRNTPQPRKLVTPLGDEFYEVAPDEFMWGDNWAHAVRNYAEVPHEATSERKIFDLFPETREENI